MGHCLSEPFPSITSTKQMELDSSERAKRASCAVVSEASYAAARFARKRLDEHFPNEHSNNLVIRIVLTISKLEASERSERVAL